MAWRVAKSLLQLRSQINAAYPGRSVASDGTIGDPNHSSRTSDHNPSAQGVVCALDITHDPAHGLDARNVAEALVASNDPRIKYIISNGQICSGLGQGHPAWQWRKYTGANPHDKHFHLSVRSPAKLYDDASPWDLSFMEVHPPAPTAESDRPMLRKGIKGNAVADLQRALNAAGASLTVDGDFGERTRKAVVTFQKVQKLVADGIVGPYTWAKLV